MRRCTSVMTLSSPSGTLLSIARRYNGPMQTRSLAYSLPSAGHGASTSYAVGVKCRTTSYTASRAWARQSFSGRACCELQSASCSAIKAIRSRARDVPLASAALLSKLMSQSNCSAWLIAPTRPSSVASRAAAPWYYQERGAGIAEASRPGAGVAPRGRGRTHLVLPGARSEDRGGVKAGRRGCPKGPGQDSSGITRSAERGRGRGGSRPGAGDKTGVPRGPGQDCSKIRGKGLRVEGRGSRAEDRGLEWRGGERRGSERRRSEQHGDESRVEGRGLKADWGSRIEG